MRNPENDTEDEYWQRQLREEREEFKRRRLEDRGWLGVFFLVCVVMAGVVTWMVGWFG